MKPPYRMMIAALACLLNGLPAMAFPEGKRTYVAEPNLDAHQQTVKQAIDETARTFNFLFRGLVRSKLRQINPVYDHIVVEYSDPTLTLSSGDLAMTLTGKAVAGHPHTTPKGLSVTVDQTIDEWTVRRRYNAPNGYQEVLYTVDASLKTLRLDIEVGSRHFSAPMRFELMYRLDEAAAGAQKPSAL